MADSGEDEGQRLALFMREIQLPIVRGDRSAASPVLGRSIRASTWQVSLRLLKD